MASLADQFVFSVFVKLLTHYSVFVASKPIFKVFGGHSQAYMYRVAKI